MKGLDCTTDCGSVLAAVFATSTRANGLASGSRHGTRESIDGETRRSVQDGSPEGRPVHHDRVSPRDTNGPEAPRPVDQVDSGTPLARPPIGDLCRALVGGLDNSAIAEPGVVGRTRNRPGTQGHRPGQGGPGSGGGRCAHGRGSSQHQSRAHEPGSDGDGPGATASAGGSRGGWKLGRMETGACGLASGRRSDGCDGGSAGRRRRQNGRDAHGRSVRHADPGTGRHQAVL